MPPCNWKEGGTRRKKMLVTLTLIPKIHKLALNDNDPTISL